MDSSESARTLPPACTLWALLCVAASTLIINCGDGDADGEFSARDSAMTHVMVIDEGFDLSLPVFDGKLQAAYTVVCEEAADPMMKIVLSGTNTGGASQSAFGSTFDDAKAALLAGLALPDSTCQLRVGIPDKKNPFVDLTSQRLRWNAAMRSGDLIAAPPLAEQLVLRLWAVPFHGTATAGIIAYDNPDVRLVLVEQSFWSLGNGNHVSTCPTQESIDETVALLSEPEVTAAYVARPLSALDRALAEVARLHSVNIVNESYGRISREGLEQLLAARNCSPVSLRPYFVIMSELERLRDDANSTSPPLIVKASGNDGALLKGPEDSTECRIGDSWRLLVGSYRFDGARSKSSNFGDCVDLYAPGEDILAHLPGDWLFPLTGTSFAAPLVVRLLSEESPKPFDLFAARRALLAMRESTGKISAEHFPKELLWNPTPKSLTSVEQAPSAVDLASRHQVPRVSELALHRALWPVKWLEAWHKVYR